MQIAIGLYPGFTALDAIGPYQVFTQVPDVDVVLCAERTGRLSDDNGLLHLDVEHTFAEVTDPDLLLVPGGFITRKLARERDPIVEWVAATHPSTTYTTSVCTGALLLGAAGVLEGLDATTHWSAYDELASYGAQPTEQRVIQQGKVWTAAGVSAGIDLALTLLAEIWGPELSQAVQLGIEYDPQPPYDAGSPTKADPEILDLVRAVSAQREADVLA
ncbi:DJ-1/PfpI family protein [Aquihabitans sp. G128]|uniref:DJ-1/PfpI family protein n=1 Tax=Aquihabitans sp. G128 TaxID=2849779 RepID=UPI001C24B3B1|nr:DJ-1/PfpI family protein [Aquihabitans sp. G128]QXC62328.1 DJ-1/PfpI family protein [Aquihabitans sp. G128]